MERLRYFDLWVVLFYEMFMLVEVNNYKPFISRCSSVMPT